MDQRDQLIRKLLGTSVHVRIDRPMGYQHGDIVYPVNYGFLPGIFAGDGEEQDAYILCVDHPLTEFDGQVIGAVRRLDDVEDKLIVAPQGTVLHQGQIAQAVHFQEQYFTTTIDSLLRRSCGVLAWREQDGNREYLIVFEAHSQCWSLPKGHMEAGETEQQTALRELWEETGLTAELADGTGVTTEYTLREHPCYPLVRKQVVYFLGQVSGSPRTQPGEITAYRWIRREEFAEYLFPDTVAACETLLRRAGME